MVIRCQRGLGDAVYCYPYIKHFLQFHDHITVLTKYSIVFTALKSRLSFSKDFNSDYDIFLDYAAYRNSDRSQYHDIAYSAGVEAPPFIWDFPLRHTEEFLRQYGRKINQPYCIIKEPAAANMHKRQSDFSFAPNVEECQQWVNKNKENYFFISVGWAERWKARLHGIDLDLNNKISVQDLIVLVKNSAIVASQVGHLLPMAQGLQKNLKIFWPDKIVDPRFEHFGKHKAVVI